MSFVINLLVFLLVLIFYLQLTEQHKKNNDLEVYQLDYIERKEIRDYCRLKLPIVINYNNVHPEFVSQINRKGILETLSSLQIKNQSDFYKDIPDNSYVEMDTKNANILFETSTDEPYYTEKNGDSIQASSLRSVFESNNFLLKPEMNLVTEYDILFGKEGSQTPFRYHTQCRKFICCHEGSVSIKMSSWDSTELLNPIHNYEGYDFRSPINVWNPQANWTANVKQMETLDIVLEKGCMLYIPSFWWYSIQFNSESLVSSSQYSSAMNCVYNLPSWTLHYIQKINVETQVSNLKTYLSLSPATPNKEIHEEAREPIEDVPPEPIVELVSDEPTPEHIQEDNKMITTNEDNAENEIKETLDSIASTIEEEHHV